MSCMSWYCLVERVVIDGLVEGGRGDALFRVKSIFSASRDTPEPLLFVDFLKEVIDILDLGFEELHNRIHESFFSLVALGP